MSEKHPKLTRAQAKHKAALGDAGIDYESDMGRTLRASFLAGWMAAGGPTRKPSNNGWGCYLLGLLPATALYCGMNLPIWIRQAVAWLYS